MAEFPQSNFWWRHRAYTQFRRWRGEGKETGYTGALGNGGAVLSKLLGYSVIVELSEKMNDNDINTIKQLIGPHGWAVYKMILARRNLTDTDIHKSC